MRNKRWNVQNSTRIQASHCLQPLKPGLPLRWKRTIIEEALRAHQADIRVLDWQVVWLVELSLDMQIISQHYPEARKVIRGMYNTWIFPFSNGGVLLIAFHFWRHSPDFIGLHKDLFANLTRFAEADANRIPLTDEIGRDRDLCVPFRFTICLEEMAHCLDFRLRSKGSPYASNGEEWNSIEFIGDVMRPFSIPNRKDYNPVIEDWASTVVWYIFRPEAWSPLDREGIPLLGADGKALLLPGLKEHSPERYEFAKRLFNELE